MAEADRRAAQFIPSGHDRFSQQRGMGITTLSYKVSSQDSAGDLFIIEQTMLAKGGPPRHLHFEQDEWFYAIEGQFIVEVAESRFTINPGDSIFAPRNIPHVWAYVGDPIGKILIAFSPAGKMEAFFNETTKANAMPSQSPELWLAHGMQVLGPPLKIP